MATVSEVLYGMAICAVYLGFAAILGTFAHYAYGQGQPVLKWPLWGFGGLVFLPASLSLPLPVWGVCLLWIAACGLITGFSARPKILSRLWRDEIILRYFSLVMYLIVIWSFSSCQFSWITFIGVPAALAGWLVWKRSTGWAFSL